MYKFYLYIIIYKERNYYKLHYIYCSILKLFWNKVCLINNFIYNFNIDNN